LVKWKEEREAGGNMARTRKSYPGKVKFQVVLELLKGKKNTVEVARAWGTHVTTVRGWREEFLKKGPEIFSKDGSTKEHEEKIAELEKIIGQQTIEIALLKKFLGGWDSVSRKK
jgi:transposase-like protein